MITNRKIYKCNIHILSMKKGSLKTKLASIALAGLSMLPTAKAKTLELDMTHPFATFDSRANLNYSANQATQKALDQIDDKNLLTRVAKTTAESYAAYLFSYITHEAAHDGTNTEFTSELRPGTLTPKTKTQNLSFNSSEEESAYFARGVNQNTRNANTILENAVLNNEAPGLPFIFNSLYLAGYKPNKDTRSKGQTTNDLDAYSNALAQRGIKTSRKKIQRNALIANALTPQNWATIFGTAKYIATGEKTDSPLTFKIANIEFTSPETSLYLGENGLFYNAKSFINPNSDSPLSVSIGTENGVTRVGAKKYNVRTPIENLTMSPSAYLSSSGGYSAGTDLELKLSPKSSLKLALTHSKNDLMGKIKGEKGFSARASLKYQF
jgi:hypothetical protein